MSDAVGRKLGVVRRGSLLGGKGLQQPKLTPLPPQGPPPKASLEEADRRLRKKLAEEEQKAKAEAEEQKQALETAKAAREAMMKATIEPGWLWHKSDEKMLGRSIWTKFYATWNEEQQCVVFFDKKGDVAKGKMIGTLLCKGLIDVKLYEDKKDGKRFDVTAADNTVFAYKAESREVAAGWVMGLRRVMVKEQEHASS